MLLPDITNAAVGGAFTITGIVVMPDEQPFEVILKVTFLVPAVFQRTSYGPTLLPDTTVPPLKFQVYTAPVKGVPV